jgi:hypothetical protein
LVLIALRLALPDQPESIKKAGRIQSGPKSSYCKSHRQLMKTKAAEQLENVCTSVEERRFSAAVGDHINAGFSP